MINEPAKRYRDFVESFVPQMPCLPAMHTTFGKSFVRIMDSHEIMVGKHDQAIGKSASFHFYGKPSFRPEHKNIFSKRVASALYCIVLDYSNMPVPCSMLPFDSGGFDEYIRPYCDDLDLAEFYIGPERLVPQRFITAFFGSNANYWTMTPRASVKDELNEFDLHSEAFVDLCGNPGPVAFDHRAATIELHYDQAIKLTSANVLAVVAPDTSCDAQDLKNFAASLNAELISYPLDLDAVAIRQRQIRDVTFQWLKSKALIS